MTTGQHLNSFFIRLLLLGALLILRPGSAQPITVEDSRGLQTLPGIPQRVIVLDWAATENLIELGITPLAVADTRDYAIWVKQPALPPGVIDVGTRDTPNIERIMQLKPDVIIIGGHQQALLEKLKPIAPVLVFTGYSRDHDNSQAARHIFLTLAQLFDKQATAEQLLAQQDAQLEQWQAQIHAHFDGQPPLVAAVRFNTPALVWVYGDNSMPQYALQRLGLTNALPLPGSQWGGTQQTEVDLAAIGQGVLLHFEPFEQKQQLFATPLWQAMPFVQHNHVGELPSIWTYGGPLSIGYMAQAITEQLLAM